MRIIPDCTPDNDMGALRALALDHFGSTLMCDLQILDWAWCIDLITDEEHAWMSGGGDTYEA